MTTSQLPPQAYTREVLAHAFEWLQSQPGSVRELANNTDTLVALYLQSKRRTLVQQRSFQTDPVSSKSFKSDLKTLAEGLKQFDSDDAPTPKTATAPEPKLSAPKFSPKLSDLGLSGPKPAPETSIEPQAKRVKADTTTVYSAPPPTIEESTASVLFDQRTHEAIQYVRNRFNLGSDQEALRMLIALGIEKVRTNF